MPYNDFGRHKTQHRIELAKLLANPRLSVFVPVGMFSDYLNEKVYMVCINGEVTNGIWLTKKEGLMLDKRISSAIDRFIKEIQYDILPEVDSEFEFQNSLIIKEVSDGEV